MLQIRIVQQRQDHGHGDTVVGAQSGAVGPEDIPLHNGPNGIFGKVKLHAGGLLADHVRVSLQDHRVRCLVAWAGGFGQHHVVGRIPIPRKAPVLSKLHQIVGDGTGVSGAVGDTADGFKIAEYRLGFQLIQYAHRISSLSARLSPAQ